MPYYMEKYKSKYKPESKAWNKKSKEQMQDDDELNLPRLEGLVWKF